MKKYLRLTCSVCKRTIDKLVDNTRFTPDRCTITLKCQGRLQPVEYRSDGQITATSAPGVTDWVPRGTVVNQGPVIQAERLVDTSTGSLSQLVLAVRLPSAPDSSSTAVLVLNERPEAPKDFKSYVYRRDSEFSTISGPEDGVSKKTLKFRTWGPDPDVVDVYLNGQKLTQGTGPSDYQVDDGTPTPPAPSNTIKFNNPVLPDATWQVEVIVSKAVPVVQVPITFNRQVYNALDVGTGSWENVSHIERITDAGSASYYLFSHNISQTAAPLRLETVLYTSGSVIVTSGATVTSVPLSDCFFALSRKPHYKVDRYPSASVPLSSLVNETNYLKYSMMDDNEVLFVTEKSVVNHFPPPQLIKFTPEQTIKTAVAGSEEQLIIDDTRIVGPDA